MSNYGSADLQELLGYKLKYASANTDAERLEASSAADALRARLSQAQGGSSIGGSYSGTKTAAEIQAMLNPSTNTTSTNGVYTAPVRTNSVTAVRPEKLSGQELAELLNINTNVGDFESRYTNAVNAAYDVRYQQQGMMENSFYDMMGNGQNTVLDTLKRNSNAAVASGASKGVQAAQNLAAVLNLSQESVAQATGLSQERGLLADRQLGDNAEARRRAFVDSEAAKLGLTTAATNYYGYDAANYAAELGANSNDLASYSAYLAQLQASDKALAGQAMASNRSTTYNGAPAAAGANTNGHPLADLFPDWDTYPADVQSQLTIIMSLNEAGATEKALALLAKLGLSSEISTPGGARLSNDSGIYNWSNFGVGGSSSSIRNNSNYVPTDNSKIPTWLDALPGYNPYNITGN